MNGTPTVPARPSLGEKEIATLRAKAALAGVVLHAIEDDHGAQVFVLSKWARTHEARSADEVEAFLRRIGGAKA